MTELERRAMLGDKDAQLECTEKGIVLPCPFCKGVGTLHSIDLGKSFYGVCQNCGFMTKNYENTKDALAQWNTRPAAPIGRCWECKEYDTESCSDGCGWCQVWDIGRFDDGFCDKFKSKEREENAVRRS